MWVRDRWELTQQWSLGQKARTVYTELSGMGTCVEFCSVCSPRAGRVFERAITQPIVCNNPWHHIDQLRIRARISARAFTAAKCCARPRARRRRSLNILTAREPMGLSSRRRLILLASHRMVLTRERKNPSQIDREIEFFSIFAQSEEHRHSDADIEGFICSKLKRINQSTSRSNIPKDGRERYVLFFKITSEIKT